MFVCLTIAASCSASTFRSPSGSGRSGSRRHVPRQPRARHRALSDPTRLTIAAALLDADELCVCDLAWIAERSQTLVSHHVRALRTHGIVRSRRDGKMVMYSLTEEGRALLASVLAARARRRARYVSDRARLVQLGDARPRHCRSAARTDAAERRGSSGARDCSPGAGSAGTSSSSRSRSRAGLAAGSIALIGFGADSLIEALAGGVVLWLFTGDRRGSQPCRAARPAADRRQLLRARRLRRRRGGPHARRAATTPERAGSGSVWPPSRP